MSVNRDAEIQAVLSVLVSRTPDIRDVLMGRLAVEHFADEQCVEIHQRISAYAQTTGYIPSLNVLLTDGALSAEAKVYLGVQHIPVIETVEDRDYLLTTLDYHRKIRSYQAAMLGVAGKLKKAPADLDGCAGVLENVLAEVHGGKAQESFCHIGHGSNSQDLIEQVVAPDKRAIIPSSFRCYDDHTGGFRRGNVLIIAATRKGGKSICKLNMLRNLYRHYNLSVCDVSLEMSEPEEIARLIAIETQIPSERIQKRDLTPGELTRIRRTWDEFQQHGRDHGCRFTILRESGISPTQIELMLKPMKFDVVAVDYISLMGDDAGYKFTTEAASLSERYRRLKQIADRLNCLMIVLAQLDEDTGKLRYSRSGYEHGNVIWTWTRDEASKAQHELVVSQTARAHDPFPFSLKEDFSTCRIYSP